MCGIISRDSKKSRLRILSIDFGRLRAACQRIPVGRDSLRNRGPTENYNVWVARGWESKSVEAQQSEAEQGAAEGRVRMSAAEAASLRQREGLRLSRERLRQQLEASSNPRMRQMLQDALAELERKLSALG